MIVQKSDKLKIVNVSKLNDFNSCQRKYFERYVNNLESVWMSRPYWYGSRCGAGAEALLAGKSWRQAQKLMKAEDKRFFDRYKVREADREAIDIERQLIDVILQAFRHHPDFERMAITSSQNKFRVKLRDSGLIFTGTEDGSGTYDDGKVLFELKNLAQVTDNIMADLVADPQINGYVFARRLLKESYATKCMYLIFRKTSKKVKRGQTVLDFVEEIRQDVESRPEFYFHFKPVRLGRQQVSEVGYDIEALSLDLKCKYERLGKAGVVERHNWPRSKACSNFAGCVYRKLCNESNRRAVWEQDYQARELRYEGEQDELQQ